MHETLAALKASMIGIAMPASPRLYHGAPADYNLDGVLGGRNLALISLQSLDCLLQMGWRPVTSTGFKLAQRRLSGSKRKRQLLLRTAVQHFATDS